MSNRSEKRKVMKLQSESQKKAATEAMDLFVRIQMMPKSKRRQLARDLVRQNDLRRAAKKRGVSFRAFRKEMGICR
jgi:hypothetical protein